MSRYPRYRPRRNRRSPTLRALVRETRLDAAQLVFPLFVVPGRGAREEISSMPGVERLSVDELLPEVEAAREAGVRSVLLFGVPDDASKDGGGSGADDPSGLVQTAVRALKAEFPDVVAMTDVCLCAYTSHGHCGVLGPEGEVLNDPSLDRLARMALSHAEAGADVVAPSDMMDGRVGAVRAALDEGGRAETSIMSYAAKYASAFYGPFRDAARSAPGKGDRKGYQMDPANAGEALREVRLDIEEGADIVMVKPAMPCLDVVHRVKEETGYPVAAYQVSGEYASLMAASARGWLDEEMAMREALLAMRRAGADIIITYWAKRYAEGGSQG